MCVGGMASCTNAIKLLIHVHGYKNQNFPAVFSKSFLRFF